jgi:alpha-L-rhamnosidase
MNSQNHIMLGSVDAWFYRTLAGLAPLLPGWRALRVRPHVLGDLTSAEARIETFSGRVGAAWRKSDDSFALEVTVPVGAKGEVHVPLLWPGARILESGRDLWRAGRVAGEAADIELAGDDGKWAVFKVGSGKYRFEAKRG